MLKPIVRATLLTVGALSVVLGVVGIFLPVLPTTPFLLLAAACFARSCNSCHAWLMQHRWFASFLRNWHERHGVTLRQKTAALILLWVGIAFSIAFGTSLLWVRVLLAGIATCTTLYLLLGLKTLER
ncbi:MAG: YbaN family protein [Rhodospirillaceae bacterium]